MKSLKLIIEGVLFKEWNENKTYTLAHFEAFSSAPRNPLSWVSPFLRIKGIQKLDITREMVPKPWEEFWLAKGAIEPIGFHAAFSASIENGFADYLREKLISV